MVSEMLPMPVLQLTFTVPFSMTQRTGALFFSLMSRAHRSRQLTSSLVRTITSVRLSEGMEAR